eukprot:ctg_1347.g439
MFTPFIIPVHFEDLAVRARQRVRSGEEDEERAKYVRFSVTPDLYDLADQLSVSEAVRVASSEVALEAEDLEALGDTGGAEWRNGWWLAHATASGLEQFQALYWCVHHWASLDTALARGQVASRVATGMRHVAAMAEATDAEGSDAPALMLSAGRLAAFVGAFLVQVMEQSLEDSVVPTGLTTPAPRPAAHPRPRRQKQRAARRPTSASDSSDVDDGDEENGDSPVDEMLLACADFDWSASEQREAFLEQFARLIESSAVLRAMFGRNAAEEAYVNLFCRAAYRLMESATTCKDKRVRAHRPGAGAVAPGVGGGAAGGDAASAHRRQRRAGRAAVRPGVGATGRPAECSGSGQRPRRRQERGGIRHGAQRPSATVDAAAYRRAAGAARWRIVRGAQRRGACHRAGAAALGVVDG